MPDTCRICGQHFGLWIGAPMDDGLCPRTQTRDICREARDEAHAAAMRRKACPDAFDETGKCVDLIRVIDAMTAQGLDPWTGRPARKRADA